MASNRHKLVSLLNCLRIILGNSEGKAKIAGHWSVVTIDFFMKIDKDILLIFITDNLN